jgi:short subunit dehydrogenase-like uncharacterized protein
MRQTLKFSRTSISGGTALTAISLVENHSLSDLAAADKPFALSPMPAPKSRSSASFLTKIFGVRTVRDLGLLTTSVQATSDVPIVQRSWGLLGGPKFYGPNFFFEQYAGVRGYLRGIALHMVFSLGAVLLMLAPFRWLLKRLVPQPGDGPTEESIKGNRAEYRAVAYPDVATRNPPRAWGRCYFEGGIYNGKNYSKYKLQELIRLATGLLLVEGALTILKDNVVAKKLGGGVLTPATLGQPFIDRLQKGGFKFETKMLRD